MLKLIRKQVLTELLESNSNLSELQREHDELKKEYQKAVETKEQLYAIFTKRIEAYSKDPSLSDIRVLFSNELKEIYEMALSTYKSNPQSIHSTCLFTLLLVFHSYNDSEIVEK